MLSIFALFALGMFLSAFFSGSETGFYRVPRARLILDSKSGDLMARYLFWLSNNPTLFVATTLIGNNLANYVTSLSIVLATSYLSFSDPAIAETIAPVVVAPIVFVYGELLPKNLFFHAPYALLRAGGVLFFICGVLFSPITAVLWVLSRILETLVGQTPLRLKLSLARNELRQIMEEGRQAGVLRPAQRDLAHSLISMAHTPISELCRPAGKVPWISGDASREQAQQMATRHQVPFIPVRLSAEGPFIGYVRSVELYLDNQSPSNKVKEMPSLPHDLSYVEALLRMRTHNDEVAMVVHSQDNRVIGFLMADQLYKPLFRAS
jgi:putative hemolysin